MARLARIDEQGGRAFGELGVAEGVEIIGVTMKADPDIGRRQRGHFARLGEPDELESR